MIFILFFIYDTIKNNLFLKTITSPQINGIHKDYIFVCVLNGAVAGGLAS